MTSPPIPDNEQKRQEAVRALALLDTPQEERFDRYTRFAQRLFDVPISYIGLIDADRQWFKSIQGFDLDESPREMSFCAHTIVGHETLMVPDTHLDERFKNSPIVVNPPHIRFYAGMPLATEDGYNVGTFCIADTRARVLNEEDLALFHDLGAMLETEFQTQTMATTDELTGLSNRRGFRAIAEQAVAMCLRLKRPATLMFFDLDGFKQVNDDFGHAAGDQVLYDIGKLMIREFRNSDVIARLGGDEFCVLLTGTNTENIDRPLLNLELALESENEKRDYSVGYSVGTVPLDVEKHKSVDDLLLEADAAMYRQKKARKENPPR